MKCKYSCFLEKDIQFLTSDLFLTFSAQTLAVVYKQLQLDNESIFFNCKAS